jgi:hypothetical protein
MRTKIIYNLVDIGRPMTEKVLSTKVTNEEVEMIKSIAEEKGTTVSALLRELIDDEITKKNVDWFAPCFGINPRYDKPKKQRVTIDEVVYGK